MDILEISLECLGKSVAYMNAALTKSLSKVFSYFTLAGVVQWIEHQPVTQRVSVRFPVWTQAMSPVGGV